MSSASPQVLVIGAGIGGLTAALCLHRIGIEATVCESVSAMRPSGVERVMQIVEDRAPQGFSRLSDVISDVELNAIASQYKQIAGFDPAALNRATGLSAA